MGIINQASLCCSYMYKSVSLHNANGFEPDEMPHFIKQHKVCKLLDALKPLCIRSLKTEIPLIICCFF